MKATQRVLAPRGQLDRLFGCYPVGREQILLPRASQGRRIRSDRPGIRGMSDKNVHPPEPTTVIRARPSSGAARERRRNSGVAAIRPAQWTEARRRNDRFENPPAIMARHRRRQLFREKRTAVFSRDAG